MNDEARNQAGWQAGQAKLGKSLQWALSKTLAQPGVVGWGITEIRVTLPRAANQKTRIMIKVFADGRNFIGFHSDYDPEAALNGAVDRLMKDKMNWKPDVPYELRGPRPDPMG